MATQNSVHYIDCPWESVSSEVNVLNKFKLSPFYLKGCSNDHRDIPLNDLGENILRKLIGTEFVVDSEKSTPPVLWVVRKQCRYSPDFVELTCVYYMLYGSSDSLPFMAVGWLSPY